MLGVLYLSVILTNPERLIGSYSSLRHSESDYTKVSALIGAFDVTPAGEGQDRIGANIYKETAPLVFSHMTERRIISFQEDAAGEIRYLDSGGSPAMASIKLEGIDAPSVHRLIGAFSVAVFVLVAVVWELVD